VTSDKMAFPKPTEFYRVLALFGDNILTTDGEQWRRYKKLVGPAFTEVRHIPDQVLIAVSADIVPPYSQTTSWFGLRRSASSLNSLRTFGGTRRKLQWTIVSMWSFR
jgi:hypothetical protein